VKVKLLKKMRKRFSIDFYPNKDTEYKYELVDLHSDPMEHYMLDIDYSHETRQSAINSILEIIRFKYYKYSVKHKRENISKKVWHES
jgi:hypothetical protein